MKNIKLLICLLLFSIISVISIYSSTFLLSDNYKFIYIKQIIWYLIGFIIIFLLYKRKKEFFYKYDLILYIVGNLLLLLVLFLGTSTNGSKAWFLIPGIGSFQPSEFMKIILIIVLSKQLENHKKLKQTFKNELIIILKCFILTLIPAFLTFLEPDTGNVIIYFVILITMLFVFGIRFRWFVVAFIIIGILLSTFLYIYFYQKTIFISIFGSNFFYRMDRIIDWKNKEGMQLTNALASTGTAYLKGHGIGKLPLYFPESQNDFISSVIFSTFGYIFSVFFILITAVFDILLITIGFKQKDLNKWLISGIISVILFQQIQNIGMNIGLLPITGVTLPFISYGGSSLISYMILIGLIINTNKKKT